MNPSTAFPPDEPHDARGAKLLALGLLVVGAIGAPQQVVLPDTLKSVVAALFALAALILFAWQLDGRKAGIRWSLYLLAPLGLTLMALVSTAWAPLTMAMTEALRWLLIGTIMWLAMNAFNRSHFVHLARAAQTAVLVASLFALIEFWFDPGWFPAAAAPGSTFGNRNMFAEFVACGLPFCLWRLVRQTTMQRALLHGVATGLSVVALMATGSRAALLGSIAISLLMLAYYGAGRMRGAFGAVSGRATLAAALLAPVVVVGALGWIPTGNSHIITEHAEDRRGLTPIQRTTVRLGSLVKEDTYVEKSSFGMRRSVWAAGWRMVTANPVTGVGAGAWNAFAPLYLPETLDNEVVWYAHNEPLQMIAEYGLVAWAALLALAALVLTSLAAAASRLLKRDDADAGFQQWVAGLSVVAFAVGSMAGLPLHMGGTCYFLAIALGYLLAASPGRVLAWQPAAGGVASWAVKGGSAAAFAVALVMGIQGLRSDVHVQRASGWINALALPANRQLPKEQANAIRANALAELRKGLDIYSDHGIVTIALNNRLATLEDPASVLWLSNLMLATRPHVMDIKCNMIRANADLGNFPMATSLLDAAHKSRPNAVCLPLSDFIVAYKQGRFPEALALGRKLIDGFDRDTEPEIARYVVDTSYRAAIRVPDVDAAVAILRVRGERWRELRASSWLLAGQLLASRAPAQVVPEAQEAFKQSLASTTNPQEQQSVMSRVPEPYRRGLN